MDQAPPRRRRNATQTRARILAAAQDAFAERGYASVGIREIAGVAGVASSLLMRYFGSKAALYEEALVDALYHRGLFIQDKEGFGGTMARLMVSESDTAVIGMVVLAAGDPEARAITQRVAQQHIIEGLATWLGPPDAHARAVAMLSLMTGFSIYMHQLNAKPAPPKLVQWLAGTLQDLVDQKGP